MTALCPHCTAALSTYTANAGSESKDVEVLVCAGCDKVLGVVGPAQADGPRLDVEEIADLLSLAVSADDDDEARTVFSIVIERLDSTVETVGDTNALSDRQFERLLQILVDKLRARQRQKDQADADRRQRPQ